MDVLTTLPYYPYWEIYEGYRGRNYWVELNDMGAIYSVKLPVSKNVSSLRRVMMDSTLGLKTLFRLPYLSNKNKYDVVLMVLPPITLFPSAILGKLTGRAKLHVHVQDLQLEVARELKLLPGPLITGLEFVEKSFFRSADLVTTISQNMAEQVAAKITDSSTTVDVIENWADTDAIKPVEEKNWLKKEYGCHEESLFVVYSGNIGEKQGVEQILPAAELLEKENADIQLLILGDGASKETLLEKSRAMNLTNIRFGDLVPKEKLNLMLNGSDVQLILQKQASADSFLPSKYINILSAGIPSVVTANGGTELYNIAKGGNTSLLVEPEQPQQLCDAILKLCRDKKLRQELSGNARTYAVNHFGQDAILGRLVQRYEEILKEVR